MNKCSQCQTELDHPCIDLILNGVHYCPNCIIRIVMLRGKILLETNTLIDSDYTYYLSKKMLVRFIGRNLTKKQYFKIKEQYPNSWYLHDDFYDDDGSRLQPMM